MSRYEFTHARHVPIETVPAGAYISHKQSTDEPALVINESLVIEGSKAQLSAIVSLMLDAVERMPDDASIRRCPTCNEPRDTCPYPERW